MYRVYLPWYINQKKDEVCIKEGGEEHKGESITLLNWNVHKNNHSFKWLHDFRQILSIYEPNIITFQEYKTKSRRAILDQYDDFGYAFSPNIIINTHMSGLLNASKFKIKHFNSLFSENVEPIIKTPKVSFLTRYHLSNSKSLTVINIHMINFVKIDKFLSQMDQIKKLCLESDEALILCGDFNTWSSKRMRILNNLAKDFSLESVVFEKKSTKKSSYLPVLDHVFYRGVKLINSEILHEIKTSDHKPMLCTFDVVFSQSKKSN